MKRNIIKNLEEYREKTETGQISENAKLKVVEWFQLMDYTLTEGKEKKQMINGARVHVDGYPFDYVFDLVLNAWNAGYMTGYKNGTRSAKEKLLTAVQAKEIEKLYTPEEISSILKRLKKGKLSDITRAQADKMISRRTDC